MVLFQITFTFSYFCSSSSSFHSYYIPPLDYPPFHVFLLFLFLFHIPYAFCSSFYSSSSSRIPTLSPLPSIPLPLPDNLHFLLFLLFLFLFQCTYVLSSSLYSSSSPKLLTLPPLPSTPLLLPDYLRFLLLLLFLFYCVLPHTSSSYSLNGSFTTFFTSSHFFSLNISLHNTLSPTLSSLRPSHPYQRVSLLQETNSTAVNDSNSNG